MMGLWGRERVRFFKMHPKRGDYQYIIISSIIDPCGAWCTKLDKMHHSTCVGKNV